MSLSLRWVDEDERDYIGRVRALCYGRGQNDVEQFVEQLRQERTNAGDWVVAERDGTPVGTATAIPLTMWVRGGSIACQGVAFVGTVKTQRRRAGDESGVGTVVMNEVLKKARERGQVVSALMPFRGSYYEHFGYGFVERRCEWTVPLSIMPRHDFDSIRFYDESKDRQALEECRQRIAQRGQCDIERPSAQWDAYLKARQSGFIIVDRQGEGPLRGWMGFDHIASNPAGPDTIKCAFDTGYEEIATLKRFLGFLGSLRDQYSTAIIQFPCDLPLNLLLREDQMTHRTARNHPTSEMRPFNRMQVRVLDHLKLLGAMKLSSTARPGKVVVAIGESEGTTSRIAIEIDGDGHVAASSSNSSADVEMPDRIWSMIVCGELAATRAAELGLIAVANRTPLEMLDEFAAASTPYCREYF